VFSPNIFFYPFLALWFSISVFSGVNLRILLLPCFLHSVFLGPTLRKGFITSGDTFINPIDVSSSVLSLELEGALAGSVT